MANLPKETKGRPIPGFEDVVIKNPRSTKHVPKTPEETVGILENPQETKEVPASPNPKLLDKEQPSTLNQTNTVIIDGEEVEIKPTKLKYFRNKTASSYGLLKAIPLTEFLTYDKGVLDPNRDADQILFDFLIAVFDSSEFVRDHYDNMTAGNVEEILKIFGRLNGIDDKEEAARKNREAQAKR